LLSTSTRREGDKPYQQLRPESHVTSTSVRCQWASRSDDG
jgi:hypothetical protein